MIDVDLLETVRDVLGRGLPVRFQAKGFSMSPFIRNGDVVTLSPFNGALPRFGDVVGFAAQEPGRLTLHRVTGKKGGFYVVRGDSCTEPDGLIPASRIVGVVEKVERCGKRVSGGIGRERYVIACLSRLEIFLPLQRVVAAVFRRLFREQM